MNSVRQFRYKRGDVYSVDVFVNDGTVMSYCNWVIPDEMSEKILEMFTLEAEHAVLKKLEDQPDDIA